MMRLGCLFVLVGLGLIVFAPVIAFFIAIAAL